MTMQSLIDMADVVKHELADRQEPIVDSGWTNASRCYYFRSGKGYYVLKWSKQMYRMVNFLPEFKGKGIGVTINKEYVDTLYDHQPHHQHTYLLFATPEGAGVYGMNLSDFVNKAAEHEQPANGELVYAIPIRMLDKWCDGV